MSIKVETVNICYVCLCADRNVALLDEFKDIFHILKPQTYMYENVLLCWECRSILKKTWRFQQRIQQAQILMQTPEFLLNYSTSSLSTLQLKVIDSNCDIVYKNNLDNEDKVKIEIEKEFNQIDSDLDDKGNFSAEEIKEEEIENKINVQLIKKETTIEIQIEQENNKTIDLDKKINNEDNIEEIKDNVMKRITNEIKNKQNDSFKKKKIVLPKIPVYKEIDFSNKINKMEDFYVTTNVSYEVLKEVDERRTSMKSSWKPRIACKTCKEGFPYPIDLKRHEIVHHLQTTGPYKCCECKQPDRIRTLSKLHQHLATHSVYKCCLCPDVFRKKGLVIRHIELVHKYQYRCLHCREYFFTYREMALHYDQMHTQFICDHCGKSYKSKKAIESHMKIHHIPLACGVCGCMCMTRNELHLHTIQRHPETFNTNKELSYCVECDLQFDSVYRYKKHLYIAVAHKPRVPVKIPCPDCGKIFSRKIYMKYHYNLFHAKKSEHYCDICKKYFARGFGLRKHRQAVHEKIYPPKNKICDICGRGFNSNKNLQNHRRTHTGERPFKCSQCPAAFNQKYVKTMHEKKQHNIIV